MVILRVFYAEPQMLRHLHGHHPATRIITLAFGVPGLAENAEGE
jgi:hypothetical protein